MSDQANIIEDRAPWTIKSVHVETRKLAVACAAKEGLTIGQWLERATRGQAETDKGNAILPAAFTTSAPSGSTLPMVSPKSRTDAPADNDASVVLERLLDVLDKVKHVMHHATVVELSMPKKMDAEIEATTRLAIAMARTMMRQARGLPEPKPRDRSRDKPRATSIPRPKLVSSSSVAVLVPKRGS